MNEEGTLILKGSIDRSVFRALDFGSTRDHSFETKNSARINLIFDVKTLTSGGSNARWRKIHKVPHLKALISD